MDEMSLNLQECPWKVWAYSLCILGIFKDENLQLVFVGSTSYQVMTSSPLPFLLVLYFGLALQQQLFFFVAGLAVFTLLLLTF